MESQSAIDKIISSYELGVAIFVDCEKKNGLVDSSNRIITKERYYNLTRYCIPGIYIGSKRDEWLDKYETYLINVVKGLEVKSQYGYPVFNSDEFSKYKLLHMQAPGGQCLIDTDFNFFIEGFYSSIQRNENYYKLYKDWDSLVGIANLEGKIIIPVSYASIDVLKNGLFVAKKKHVSLISPSGEVIIGLNKSIIKIIEDPASKCLTYCKYKECNGRRKLQFGLLSYSGKVILEANYAYIDKFIDGAATINDIGVIKGVTIRYSYNEPLMYENKEEVITTIDGGHYGIIDETGHFLVEPKYSYIFRNNNGYYVASEKDIDKDKYGILDSNGQVIVPCSYSYIHPIEDGIYVYAVGGTWSDTGKLGERLKTKLNRKMFLNEAKWGIAKITGGEIIEPFADYMNSISEHKVTYRIGDTFGILDLRTKEKKRTIFNYMSVFKEGMCVVGLHIKNGIYDFGIKYGYINSFLDQVLPCEYMSASDFKNGEGRVESLVGLYRVNHSGELFSERDDSDYEYNQDNWDWEKENWNALTDGQYGDYPGSEED